MVHNSTFGASNAAKLLVLSEPEAICQIDSSTLNAMITVRLFTADEDRPLGGVAAGGSSPFPPGHNMAVDLSPFGRWTLRDKAAQRRSTQRLAAAFQIGLFRSGSVAAD